ncbi:hypothetical protein ACFPTV_10550 [Sinirhodobacter huangdaonensis]|nr:hypothetical protein [Sinirhodobacter huangdaonensis]
MPNHVPAAAPGLPAARLDVIHDCLALALDATERPAGYTRTEREARSYIRSALRQTCKLMEARA